MTGRSPLMSACASLVEGSEMYVVEGLHQPASWKPRCTSLSTSLSAYTRDPETEHFHDTIAEDRDLVFVSSSDVEKRPAK